MSPAILLLLAPAQAGAAPDAPDFGPAFAVAGRAVADGVAPGAVALVMRDGAIVRAEAFGLGDPERGRPMSADTVCWLASVTKPVTAAAAMVLVQEGRLSLDEPVAGILPEFAGLRAPDGSTPPVTVRQLLSHSSGVPSPVPTRPRNFFTPPWLRRDVSEIAPLIAARGRLEFVPGGSVAYSNAAPYVTARVIEVRSGEPFAAFVRRAVLLPAGMRDTRFRPAPRDADRVAVVRRRRAGGEDTFFRFDPAGEASMAMPDGGLFGTAADVARFTDLFVSGGGRVLTGESVAEMLTEQAPGWGLGWDLRGGLNGRDDRAAASADGGVFGHTGSAGVYTFGDPATGTVGCLFFQIQATADLDPVRVRFREAVLTAARAGTVP